MKRMCAECVGHPPPGHPHHRLPDPHEHLLRHLHSGDPSQRQILPELHAERRRRHPAQVLRRSQGRRRGAAHHRRRARRAPKIRAVHQSLSDQASPGPGRPYRRAQDPCLTPSSRALTVSLSTRERERERAKVFNAYMYYSSRALSLCESVF
jgi:hypothetical protein